MLISIEEKHSKFLNSKLQSRLFNFVLLERKDSLDMQFVFMLIFK